MRKKDRFVVSVEEGLTKVGDISPGGKNAKEYLIREAGRERYVCRGSYCRSCESTTEGVNPTRFVFLEKVSRRGESLDG